MNQIMLDLETMSASANAAIVSIGAVKFDIENGIYDEFSTNVSLASSMAHGGVIDADTVTWWMGQDDDARAQVCTPLRVSIMSALFSFEAWARNDGTRESDELWGNGAGFDNVILSNAFARDGMKVPWSHRADRCYRTMRALFPQITVPPFEGTKHHALHDARHQALHLIEILKHIRGDAP